MRIDSTINGEFQFNNEGVYGQAWSVSLVLSENEVAQITSAYNPQDNTSPDQEICRNIVRLMLDSIILKES